MKLKKPNALVSDQLGRDVATGCQDALAPGLGQPGFAQNADQTKTGQGRIPGRLDDDRAARSDCRAKLVHREVQRMIESADRNDDADGLACGECEPVHRSCVLLHRYFVAVVGTQNLDAVPDAVDRARDLDFRIDQWLAAFTRGLESQFVTTRLHDVGCFAQHLDALLSRQPAFPVAVKRIGGLQRGFCGCGATGIHGSDDRAVEGCGNFNLPIGGCVGNKQGEMISHDSVPFS